jgi:hypothetical protein
MSLVVVLVMEIGWWREGGRHVSVVFNSRTSACLVGAPDVHRLHMDCLTAMLCCMALPCPALPCPALPHLTLP